MPAVNINEVQGERRAHPGLPGALDAIADTPPKLERLTITVPADYARRHKAEAKRRGMTIKEYIMRALDAHSGLDGG